MPHCPVCHTALTTVRQRGGVYFSCPTCTGRAVTLPQIRRAAGQPFTNRLFHRINASTELADRRCPFCTRRMRRLHAEAPLLELDACPPCSLVWFDAREFEQLPAGSPPPPEPAKLLPPRARQALALRQVRRLQEQALDDPEPDAEWKWLPAFFGLPVETHTSALSRQPWLTLAVATAIVVISGLAFLDLETVVQQWGLVPATFWRHGGLTFITAFFLHGGVWHLVGNVYFLLVFGDNVEDYLGRWRWLALLVGADLLGNLLHVLGDPHATEPCVGASGGISGLVVFYALAFPRARLSFLFRSWVWWLHWVQLPAWAALVLWLLLQMWGAAEQVSGFGQVSALAHLGGALAGFLAWLLWHNVPDGPSETDAD